MQVICPNCAVRLGEDKEGRVYCCKHCGEIFTVGEELIKPNNDDQEVVKSQNEIISMTKQQTMEEATLSDVVKDLAKSKNKDMSPSEKAFLNSSKDMAEQDEKQRSEENLTGIQDMTNKEIPISSIDSKKLEEYKQLYGVKVTHLQAAIIDCWHTEVGKHSNIKSYPDIPEQMLRNAIENYAPNAKEDLIIGLVGETSFDSGKLGALFTTRGVFWKLNRKSTPSFIRYEEIDPGFVNWDQYKYHLNLTVTHRCEFKHRKGRELASLCSFVQRAAALSQRDLPEEYWEFALFYHGKPINMRRLRSKNNIKPLLEAHVISTRYLYRHYNPNATKEKEDKGDWEPIPDSLYTEIGISKNDLIKAEKINDIKGLTALIGGGVGFIVLFVVFVRYEGSDLSHKLLSHLSSPIDILILILGLSLPLAILVDSLRSGKLRWIWAVISYFLFAYAVNYVTDYTIASGNIDLYGVAYMIGGIAGSWTGIFALYKMTTKRK